MAVLAVLGSCVLVVLVAWASVIGPSDVFSGPGPTPSTETTTTTATPTAEAEGTGRDGVEQRRYGPTASLVIMPLLSWAQRRTGRELGSGSVVADSKQTLLCTYLSAVLLAGLILNAALGWSWADPIAGLIIAAVLLQVFGWTWVDPVIGAAIGLWILPRTWRLGGQAVRILLQAAPPEIDLGEVELALAAIPGVIGVHDLHVWTLTSEMENASVHLVVNTMDDSHGVLDQARSLLQDRYGIGHATLQVEPSDHEGCDELAW